MQRRYLYVLMFSVPALLASLIISFVLFGAVAGGLWLFVFGDNSWPEPANMMLVALFVLTCIAFMVALLSVAYITGRNEEKRVALNAKHVVMSVGSTAMLVFLVVAHQWSVGNIGTPSNSVLCSEFCQDQGFAGSGMPPRDSGVETCSCFDAHGGVAIKVPFAEIPMQRRR